MRHLLAILAIATAVQTPSIAAPQSASVRTIQNIPNFPLQPLRSGVGKKLYSSLAVSPVAAWLTARASIVNGHSGGATIIHEEGNGIYDNMLLEMANNYSVSGLDSTESRLARDNINVHLLIYDLKDSKMAICFSQIDDPRYNGFGQVGTAWVGVLQGGKWVTISGTYPRKWGGRRGSE